MLRWAVLSLLAVAPDERIRVEVVYDAPEACPPKARLEAELRARSRKLQLVDAKDIPQAQLSLQIVAQKKRFVGTSKVRTLLSGVTSREFKSAQCEALVQAAALATSLLLDPEGTNTGAVTLEVPPAPVLDAGLPETPVPEPVDAGAPDAGPEPVLDAGAVLVAPPQDAGSTRRDWEFEVFASGGVSTATSGAVEGVLAAGVAVRFGLVRLALSPRLTPGRRVASMAGDADVLSGGARLDGLASVSVGPFRLEAGAMLEVLAVSAAAPRAEVPGQALGLLVAPGPLGRFVLVVGPLRVALEGGLGVNTRAERFLIDGAGLVFQAPRVFGFGAGVVGVAF